MSKLPGGVIAAVEPGTFGDRVGLRRGDRLIAIHDHVLRDIIDVQFYGAEETLDLLVVRAGEQLRIEAERDYGEGLGLDFVHPTFDVDVRRCANNCEFCFVRQNAPGMRRSLYVKDDDFRYSFLFGNFVTLTNLSDQDWNRLEEQRLSPLYVSVQATDLELRRRFLGHKTAPDVMDQLRRLAKLGIQVHTQVVLVPGLNDGTYLTQTAADLTALAGAPVASVGIVPVGLTRFHSGRCRTHTAEEARALLEQVEPWRAENRRKLGQSFIFPSDEWYLVAGRQVPPARQYDGFPQLENGVGMVRQLLDEWTALKAHLPTAHAERIILVCGTLIAPVLVRIVNEWKARTAVDIQLLPVVNQFFGPVTTVSGLLTGEDVIAAVQGQPPSDLIFLPKVMFTGRYGAGSAPPNVTLDGLALDDLASRLGARVEPVGTMTELLTVLEQPRRTRDNPRGSDARHPARDTAHQG